jgi:hypothetical protein
VLGHHGHKTRGLSDRRDSYGASHHVRSSIRRALQSRRPPGHGIKPRTVDDTAAIYVGAQAIGAIVGVLAARAMFKLPLWQVSMPVRIGPGQLLAEAVATFGLLLTILRCAARTPAAVPYAVGVRLLVHRFDIVCPFGRHHRAVIAFIAAQLAGMLMPRSFWRLTNNAGVLSAVSNCVAHG